MTDSGNLTIRNSTAEFLIFTGQAGEDGIEVRVAGDTVWLTQKLMARLFAVSVPTINHHLKNIFQSNELRPDSVIRKFLITARKSFLARTTEESSVVRTAKEFLVVQKERSFGKQTGNGHE